MARYGFGADQFFDGNRPLSGGKLYFYETGTGTAKTTYSNAAMTVENTWPVVLDADGRQGDVFFPGAAKIIITSAANVQIDEVDPVYTVSGGTSATIVENMDDLRARGVPILYESVQLLGFYAPGDGGGGLFYWDAANVEDDNLGTIIEPDSHTGAGRWMRDFSGARNVRWFGATGDGVTDDHAAFQA